MGDVTGNAQLLLGFLSAATEMASRGAGVLAYEVTDVDAAKGVIVVSHRRSGNLYRVAVTQIAGTE